MPADKDLPAAKKALRARMRALPPPSAEASRAICETILRLPVFQAARVILSFMPMQSEPDIRPVLQAILEDGRTLVLPRSLPGGLLQPGTVTSLDALVSGPWNIPEPPACAPEPEQIDLVLVPGVAFDRSGRRLGHGAGYYDRFLQHTAAFSLGVCTAQNLLEAVPADARDQRMQAIVTESETLFFPAPQEAGQSGPVPAS